jgi:hypothetical protein
MKQVNTSTTPPGGYQYRQPETNQPFTSTTWQGLVIDVGNHRLGEGLDTSFGWEKQLQHDACEQNPQWDCKDASPLIPAFYVEQAAVGRALWAELHAYAAAYPVSPTEADKAKAREWLKQFAMRVPNFGCGCRTEYGRYSNHWPVELGSRAQFIRWTECLHDFVNRRTGKPFWNEEQYKASPAVNI